ncbi:MAG: hypothetical protein DCF15_05395 [Phormidesmis priestleyi]|uniref:Uncharacterized protein n=1 Tax=Phormidesmis priestleyi TaxID=268141 RepID=A0A2W4XV87_9CYAN|nr:MAG: hypothetical protein DCF15_05395 [Phormidesmis priestleyi]
MDLAQCSSKFQHCGTWVPTHPASLIIMEGSDSWQNWVFTVGYLAFTAFIIWQVVKPSKK